MDPDPLWVEMTSGSRLLVLMGGMGCREETWEPSKQAIQVVQAVAEDSLQRAEEKRVRVMLHVEACYGGGAGSGRLRHTGQGRRGSCDLPAEGRGRGAGCAGSPQPAGSAFCCLFPDSERFLRGAGRVLGRQPPSHILAEALLPSQADSPGPAA